MPAERWTSALVRDEAATALHQWCNAAPGDEVPRVLAVVAHPDDEVLGLGARMCQVAAQLHVAYVTDGAPEAESFYRARGFEAREDYARERRREARRALSLAGLEASQAHELGLVDQRAAWSIERVSEWVLGLLAQLQPEAVITHAYEGGHPDHDATACAVQLALERQARGGHACPVLWEFAGYYASGPELVLGRFIPDRAMDEECVLLDERARQDKLRLLSCHVTQRAFWSQFPLDAEHFRVAQHHDFRRPPPAPFHYDSLSWGVTGAEFLECARRAWRELAGS